MHTGRFTWQQHGPIDYADACRILALEKKERKDELNGTERKCLETLVWLFSCHGRRTPGASYLHFARAYLATALHRSVRQVSRILARLQRLGYLVRQRRAPVAGKPQSSLTRPGARLLALLYRVTHPSHRQTPSRPSRAGLRPPLPGVQKPQQNRIGTLLSHNDLKKGIEAPGRGGCASYSTTEREDCAVSDTGSGLRPAGSARAQDPLTEELCRSIPAGSAEPWEEGSLLRRLIKKLSAKGAWSGLPSPD